jgi:hypothetical protein
MFITAEKKGGNKKNVYLTKKIMQRAVPVGVVWFGVTH